MSKQQMSSTLRSRMEFVAGDSCPETDKPGPPPTTLNTLERMHAHCMELESDVSELGVMGDIDIDELKTDIESLTYMIQCLIEDGE
jgi:hypothetical protein